MDIGQIMTDLMPEAMTKLQQAAGGGAAVQIHSYELLGHTRDGEDEVYDVKYIGPQSFTVRARWRRFGSEWKIADAERPLSRSEPHAIEPRAVSAAQVADPPAPIRGRDFRMATTHRSVIQDNLK